METESILFFDTEVTSDGSKLLDIGAVKDDKTELHTTNRGMFTSFAAGCAFMCGHNIFSHDLKYVQADLKAAGQEHDFIDTLFLSPLLCHPITAMAPSFRLLVLSGIIRSGSNSCRKPRPVHTGHAPKGLLKENERGSISSMEIPQSGQEKLSE